MKYNNATHRWYQMGVYANFSNTFSYPLRFHIFNKSIHPYEVQWFTKHGTLGEL
jgi:hypothetical protein